MADPLTGFVLFLSAITDRLDGKAEREQKAQTKPKIDNVAFYPDKIQIIALNNPVPKEITDSLARKLSEQYAVPVPVARYETDISGAFVKERNQYEGKKLLDSLDLPFKEKTYAIYIIKDDLYNDPYNFLFAYTNYKEHETVISTARFMDMGTDPSLALERLNKIMMRRIGFVYGLKSDDCIMKFSNSLDELDKAAPAYCQNDADYLKSIAVLKK